MTQSEPRVQLRTFLRLDAAFNQHSGEYPDNSSTPDYAKGALTPALGLGLRMQRFEVATVMELAGSFWESKDTIYPVENTPLNWYLDFSYDIVVAGSGARVELGAGAVFGSGAGGHVWGGAEWPLLVRKSWGLDLFLNLDIIYQDWGTKNNNIAVSAVSLMANIGTAIRFGL